MNYYKPKFPLEEPKEVVTRRTERDQGAGLSRTKRRDVFRTRNYKFAKGATYTVKFGFMNEDGRCAMVLCDEHISAETVNAIKVMNEYYLNEDIGYLSFGSSEEIKIGQLVVAVDEKKQEVMRGVVQGKSGDEYFLVCPDFGCMAVFPMQMLYGTTELAAGTELAGFFCYLRHMELFKGLDLVSSSVKAALKAYPTKDQGQVLYPQMLCKVVCKDFVEGDIPIVDFWPCHVETEVPIPFNRVMAACCTVLWSLATNPINELVK